jgi:hypothetical protein
MIQKRTPDKTKPTRNLSLGSKHSALLDDCARRLGTSPSHAARIAVSLLSKQPLRDSTIAGAKL